MVPSLFASALLRLSRSFLRAACHVNHSRATNQDKMLPRAPANPLPLARWQSPPPFGGASPPTALERGSLLAEAQRSRLAPSAAADRSEFRSPNGRKALTLGARWEKKQVGFAAPFRLSRSRGTPQFLGVCVCVYRRVHAAALAGAEKSHRRAGRLRSTFRTGPPGNAATVPRARPGPPAVIRATATTEVSRPSRGRKRS